MSWEIHNAPVVTYIGTYSTSYGLATPGNLDVKTEHTLVAFPQSPLSNASADKYYVGNRAWAHRSSGKVSVPLQNGTIRADRQDDYQKVLTHAYKEASDRSDEPRPLLLVERNLNSPIDRKIASETAFELLEVPSLVTAPSALMALHSVDLRNAVLLHMGSTSCSIYPICAGSIEDNAVRHLNIGGTAISQQFMKALSDAGFALTGSQSLFEQINEAKTHLCYVSEDPKADLDAANATPGLIHKEWEISNGVSIAVGSPRFLASECLFNPSLANIQQKGLPELISESIRAAKFPELPPLVLSGGSSLLPGLSKRICKEISGYVNGQQLEVLEPQPREALPTLGGLRFASDQSRFEKFAISQAQYLEEGADYLSNKKFVVHL